MERSGQADEDGGFIRATKAPRRDNPSKRQMLAMAKEKGSIFSPENGHDGCRSLYMSMKANKQSELRVPYDRRSNIFEGTSMFFNSVQNPDDLAMLVLENGGYRVITRGIEKITHYITNDVTAGQITEDAKRTKPRDHCWVTEAWIRDSVSAGTRLPEHAYSPFPRKSGDIGLLLGQEPAAPPKRREAKDEHVSIEEDPGGFLQHYLANSRLHYIGTWRERALHKYLQMQGMANASSESSYRAPWLPSSSSSSSSSSSQERVVLHADMDCFFVSAVLAQQGEKMAHLRENLCEGPDKKIVPVAVAHSRGNKSKDTAIAEISSCNYSARRKGVKAGWPTNKALDVCPDLIVLDYDFAAYDRIIPQIYEVLLSFGRRYLPHGSNSLSKVCQVQIVSVDEAYLELPAGSDGALAARELRARVMEETGCRVSVGVGANKLLARLATKYAKPPNKEGIFVMDDKSATGSVSAGLPAVPVSGDLISQESRDEEEPERSAGGGGEYGEVVNNFILPLNLRDLPDIGRKKEDALTAQGLVTCRDVLRASEDRRLESLLKKAGLASLKKDLLKLCTGQDARPLEAPESYLVQKSIAVEVTWGVRFQTEASVLSFLGHLCRELQVRLHASTVTGVGKVIFKVKRRHASVPQTNIPAQRSVAAPGSKGVLGHGKCDDFSLGTPFKASIAPTAAALMPEVMKLYRAMESKNDVKVVDLRGIGVQCTDLVRKEGMGNGSPGKASTRGSGGILAFVNKKRSKDNLYATAYLEPALKHSKGRNNNGNEQASVRSPSDFCEVIDVSEEPKTEGPARYEGLGLTKSQEDMVDGLEDEYMRQEVLDQIQKNKHATETVHLPNHHNHHNNGKRGVGPRKSSKPKAKAKAKLSRNSRTLTSMNLFNQKRVLVDMTLDDLDDGEEGEDREIEYDESYDSHALSFNSHIQGEVERPPSFPFDEKESPPLSFSRWLGARAAEGAPDEEAIETCQRYASLLVSQKRLDVALYYARAVGRAHLRAETSSRKEWSAFWGDCRRHVEAEVESVYGLCFASD